MPQKRTAFIFACAVATTLVVVALRHPDGPPAPAAPTAAETRPAVPPPADVAPPAASRRGVASTPFGAGSGDAFVVEVVWDDGAPCPRALVSVPEEDLPADAAQPLGLSDDEGLAEMEPRPAVGLRLVAKTPDGATAEARVAAAGRTRIAMPAGDALDLHVVDAAGRSFGEGEASLIGARNGAEVVVRRAALTADGRARFRRLPRDESYRVKVEDAKREERSVGSVDGPPSASSTPRLAGHVAAPGAWQIRLAASPTYRVRCVDRAGRPVAGATASFRFRPDDGDEGLEVDDFERDPRPPTTGTDGVVRFRPAAMTRRAELTPKLYEMRRVPPERGEIVAELAYALGRSGTATGVATRRGIPDGELDFGDVALDVPPELRLAVVDEGDDPVAYADVAVEEPGGAAAATDGDGACVLRAAPGARVVVNHPRYSPEIVVAPSAPSGEPLPVRLRTTATLTVEVRPAAPKDRIHLRSVGGEVRATETVGREGVASFSRVRLDVPFEVSLAAEDDDDPWPALRLPVAPLGAGERRRVVFDVPEPASLVVTVVDADGRPLPDARANALDGAPHLVRNPTTGELFSQPRRLARPKSWRWEFEAPGARSEIRSIEIAGRTVVRVALAAGRSVLVRLRDDQGRAPGSATVEAFDAAAKCVGTRTTHGEDALLSDLPVGPLRIVATVGGRKLESDLPADAVEASFVTPRIGRVSVAPPSVHGEPGVMRAYATSSHGDPRVLVGEWSRDYTNGTMRRFADLTVGRWRVALVQAADGAQSLEEPLGLVDVEIVEGRTATVAF